MLLGKSIGEAIIIFSLYGIFVASQFYYLSLITRFHLLYSVLCLFYDPQVPLFCYYYYSFYLYIYYSVFFLVFYFFFYSSPDEIFFCFIQSSYSDDPTWVKIFVHLICSFLLLYSVTVSLHNQYILYICSFLSLMGKKLRQQEIQRKWKVKGYLNDKLLSFNSSCLGKLWCWWVSWRKIFQ